MQRFTSQDLQRNTGRVQEAALKNPVAISHHGRDRLVVLAADEYDRLKRRDRLVLAIEELPDAFIAALQQPVHDPEMAGLDHLLDE
ncbi:MAG: type II toxin-antitoxin system Phd/YefM family antitoxin [Rhodospirillaceae bacterium]|nr:type II toxin-antitoxin system Phd/YefM family antitoxin [Rhodospirillales bacterium]